jgi:hypothetical protein
MNAKMTKKDSEFSEVLSIIRAGRAKEYKAVNVALIDNCWAVGEYLSRKVWRRARNSADWQGFSCAGRDGRNVDPRRGRDQDGRH